MGTRLKVALVFGGRSGEHEVSLRSAASVALGLQHRHDVLPVLVGKAGGWLLQEGEPRPAGGTPVFLAASPEDGGRLRRLADARELARPDVFFPVLHGTFGEDGTVQGLLELAGVPYVGAGVAASAVCMDKDLCKAVLRDHGIPVARNVTLREGDSVEHPFPYPVFVKPARLGSSVGISKVHDESELQPAVDRARRHDDKVLIEEFVPGVEVECSVLGNREPIVSEVGEIVAHAEWYDYAAKYDEGGMDLVIPASVPPEARLRVQELAVESFVATDCEGMARIDFFARPDGEIVVNEINTIPGFTSTSVYAALFEASGITYAELLDRLVELALERHERRSRLKF